MIARGRAAAQEQAHSLVIEGTRVELVLRRSARRSFALQVDHRGARVAVPLRAPLGEVERFVHSHGRWLLDRLQARAAARPLPLLDVVDGATVPLFGRALTLRLRVGRLTRWHPLTDVHEELLLPTAVDPLRALLRALQARALAWYRGRVEEYCHRLDLPMPAVRLSTARTRWAMIAHFWVVFSSPSTFASSSSASAITICVMLQRSSTSFSTAPHQPS